MKLSIITINKNNAPGLCKTIESVVSQSYTDFEYIVIDGASVDGSVDVIRQYEDKISYWVSEPDNGIYNAMNKGITQAKGEYIQFLNSGDYLVDNTILKKIFDNHYSEDIVYGDMFVGNPERSLQKVCFPKEDDIDFDWMVNMYLPHGASFIKNKLFKDVGLYSEDLKIVSDWEFFLLATCKYNCSLKYCGHEIIVYDNMGVSSKKENLDIINLEKAYCMHKHFSRVYSTYINLANIRDYLMRCRESFLYRMCEKFFVRVLGK